MKANRQKAKVADTFSSDTFRIVSDALEMRAKAYEIEASRLPFEYSTGVSTNDLNRRPLLLERANDCRRAIKQVRAIADRSASRQQDSKQGVQS